MSSQVEGEHSVAAGDQRLGPLSPLLVVAHVLVNDQDRIADEMGDILFACVNLSRHLDVNPEQALRDSNLRFISRFTVVEQLLQKDGRQMDGCSVEELEDYWEKAKTKLSANER